ncbi:MAG: hypothetical protein ACJAY5_000627 [Actinomycetes bacterium]|jgi:hypothetical protein
MAEIVATGSRSPRGSPIDAGATSALVAKLGAPEPVVTEGGWVVGLVRPFGTAIARMLAGPPPTSPRGIGADLREIPLRWGYGIHHVDWCPEGDRDSRSRDAPRFFGFACGEDSAKIHLVFTNFGCR